MIFLFQGKNLISSISSIVFFLVGKKILLPVFQELSMGFGWKLFWVVNALL